MLIGLMMATVSLTQAKGNGNPNPGISPIHSNPADHSYSEWAGAWWQWSLGIPAVDPEGNENPMVDTDGSSCALGQSGDVWFLAGTWGGNDELVTRECTVPTGTRFFFPILNEVWVNFPEFGDDPDNTLEDMLEFIAFDPDDVEMSAEIDGVPVKDLKSYRAFSEEPFQVHFPEDNLFDPFVAPLDITEGFYGPSAADGFWLMVNPLKKGDHEISFRGNNDGFSLDVKYLITVE
jgi:hypothetical protein